MKTKITIIILQFMLFSSVFYSQDSQPLNRKESGAKSEIEYASMQKNILINGLSNARNDLSGQKTLSNNFSPLPPTPAAYIPGYYYVESFEDGVIPGDWQVRDIAGNNKWGIAASYTFGDYCAISSCTEMGVADIDWLITPHYKVYPGDSLSFYIEPAYLLDNHDTLWVLLSLENEVPDDRASLDGAFADELFTIAYDTLNYGWYKYSFSLEKYAGEEIYIAFKQSTITGCSLYLDNICLGQKPKNDVFVASLSLGAGIKKGDNFYPVAEIKNWGLMPQSFSVQLKIEDWYLEKLDFTDVAPGVTVTPNFKAGIALDSREYTAEVAIISETDENPYNDTLSINFHVFDKLEWSKWHSETPMPFEATECATASYTVKSQDPGKPDTNYIYVFGVGMFRDTIYKYNDVSKTWSLLGALPEGLINFAIAQVNGKVYIMGGSYTYSGTSDKLYIFDMEKETFTLGAPLPTPLVGSLAGVYDNNLIYLAGGDYPYNSNIRNNVFMYNIYTDTWSEATPLPGEGGCYMAGAICDNTFIVAGGDDYSLPFTISDIVYYGKIDAANPGIINWTKDQLSWNLPFYKASSGFWSGINSHYIFITGGRGYDTTFSSLWIYDVDEKKWLGGEDRLIPVNSASGFVPVIRNDSVYMAILGGEKHDWSYTNFNDWLYIGPNNAVTTDIAAVSIDIDTAYISDINIPKATFKNRSFTTQKFNATLVITPGDYSSAKEINIKFGEKQINFDPWIPENAGIYTAIITANLSTDQDSTNNTFLIHIAAVQRQISPLWHAEAGISDSTENLEAVYYLKKSGNPSIPDTGYIIVFADLWKEGDGYSRGSISKYNTVTRNWSVPDSSFIWVRYYHPVLLGGKIYFIGGQVEGTTCIYCGNELMIYDIEKDSVYYGSPMLKQCDSYAVGTFADNLIYVLGGYSYDNNVQGEYNGFLNLAQIYNVNTDTWSYGTPFPGIRRCKINGSISGSTIVLAGGYSEQGDASTVDIGVIDPADPSIINWWQKPFLNQMNLENFPGGKTQGLASGAWFGRDTKAVYFAEGRKIWQYNVSTGGFSEMPEKVYTTDKLSALMPIVRNDSVYLAMIGRDKVSGNITNEWYYIGNDAADPDIANEEEPNLSAPKEYSLLQNYPNPFNPSTKIKYSLREPGHVTLTVYDMLGREIKTLINETMSAGGHEVIFNAGELNLSSGIYLYRIKSGSFVQTKKFMLIK